MSNLLTPDAPRIHHPYSPSKLQALEACPGYESADTESEASRAGTLQHEAFETGDLSKLHSDEQVAAVECCQRYWAALCEQAVKVCGGLPPILLKETRVAVDDEETTAGFLDAAVVTADKTQVDILDFKFGRHEVEAAETNLQGFAYLLGVVRLYPTIERARVHFLLPHREETVVADFRKEHFPAMLLRIKTVVARAKNPESQRNPNVGCCLFCKKLGSCNAVFRFAVAVGRKYAPLQIPEDMATTASSHSPESAGLGMKVATLLEAWAKAFRSQVAMRAVDEEAWIPNGYELVPATRRTILQNKVFRDVAKEAGVTDEQLDAMATYPLGEIEKLVAEKAPRGRKKQSLQELDAAWKTAGAIEEGTPFVYLKMKASKARE